MPATPNKMTNDRTRRPDGTGTASLENGDDKSTCDVAGDTAVGSANNAVGSANNVDDDGGGAAMNGSSCSTVMNGSSCSTGSGGGISAGASLSA